MDYKHYMNIKVVVGAETARMEKSGHMLEFLIFTTDTRLVGEAERKSSIQLSSHSSHPTSGW